MRNLKYRRTNLHNAGGEPPEFVCVCALSISYETTLWWTSQRWCDGKRRILAVYQSPAVSPLCRVRTQTCYVKIILQCWLELGQSPLSQAGTEAFAVSAVPVSKAPANTLNPMWFESRCWLWCRGAGLGLSAWCKSSPAGRTKWRSKRIRREAIFIFNSTGKLQCELKGVLFTSVSLLFTMCVQFIGKIHAV